MQLTVLAQQGDVITIGAPDDILDRRRSELSQNLLLLDIEQRDRGGGCEDQRSGTAVEDIVGLDGAFDRFDDVVRQVPSLDVLGSWSAWHLESWEDGSLPDQPCPALPICFERQRLHCILHPSFHPRVRPCRLRRWEHLTWVVEQARTGHSPVPISGQLMGCERNKQLITHRGDQHGSLGRVVAQCPWLNPL